MNNIPIDDLCALVVAGLLLSGCAGTFSGQPRVVVSEQKLQDALIKETTTNRELEEKLAGFQLLLLEQEAQDKELNKKLEEATLEVVRAKAKLHSLESKAEAASTLAEGEIALKALKSKAIGLKDAGGVKDAGLVQAEALLNASNLELKKENYGGALYLAARAKLLIKEDQERLKGREKSAMLEGEVPFAMPLLLRVVSPGNVREGPGLDSTVLFSLQEGHALVGYSYRGLWVRVRAEDGRGGWIHYNLVGGRSKER